MRHLSSNTKIKEDIYDKKIIVVDVIVIKKRMIEKKLNKKLSAQEKTSVTEYTIWRHLLEHVADE